MARCEAIFYLEDDGTVPALEWLRGMARRDSRVLQKLQARIERLEEMGHELRRPEGDLLRDGIHELRARLGSTNFRLLYFFDGREIAILVHGLTKEAGVPNPDIERALERKRRYERDPSNHRYEPEQPEESDEE
ncbi:MAG TPA: type II toxin-antitoxin system RelE/ParE family toxin [Armatimonadota bacterium]|nr:type II toxin-antitoxin system RelE/ParE family toxin [Armatimonadota bacterium]